MHSSHYNGRTAIKKKIGCKSIQARRTHVIGFMNGTLTSTASATKFSTSRSIGNLYLDLTYSGLAAYRQATRPPSGVIPTRSPMPNTASSDLIPVSLRRVDERGKATDKYRCVWRRPRARYKRLRWPCPCRCASEFQCHNRQLP